MTYDETLDYLYGMLPMYQRIGKAAYKQDLSNTIELLEKLDNPHRKFKSVHIAGTNGKGTSAHGIAAILQTAGYKTGLYTSPHLKRFTERIRINGEEVDDGYVVEFVERIKDAIELVKPSFFEVTVAMAFDYFAQQQVDIAIIETGLGGRLDSTNVITPEVSLITNIGMDHTDLLGDTLVKIAGEKAGIIKEHVPVVIGNYQEEVIEVFEQSAESRQAPIILAETKFESPELPDYYSTYFKKNVPGMLAVIAELNTCGFTIAEEHVSDGLLHVNELTGLKGRFQRLSEEPLTIADVSHNKEGLEILMRQVAQLQKDNLHMVFGTVKDKPLEGIFSLLPKGAHYYWSESNVPRSLDAETLQESAAKHGLQGKIYKEVNEAISAAALASDNNDLILITGSTFLVSEIKEL